ncbi:hypothetical protein [Glaciimonas immobilis]|uniref:Uncharacterized protein n=1 Tax=Glaciimonas immobilis TaxID=728004 RepID=A0A840RRT6_9BURK|nr:hypothetical protein [Glaciimonas immobilis]KAF3996870.1 hypothetical protein HAV38_14295 [Glaciimonas immobilis]MBB5199676.1 hypothetical protein [Glaciimonas immobilis]
MTRYASTTPTQNRLQTIQCLTRQSTVMAATLSAFDMLVSASQRNALAHCHELATDVFMDWSALIGGAA